jgi:hypothetical protein
MNQLTEYEKLSLQKLEGAIHQGRWNNEGLVRLIELAGEYLNIKTIPDYAKKHKLTYNGVKKCRSIRTIYNVKFVIDNE